ncbi:hypothetical protein ACFQVA_05615 [Actinomadura keratinilytica]
MTSGALLSLLMAPVRMSVEKVVPQLAKGTELAKIQGLVQSMEVSAMAVGPALAMLGVAFLDKIWLLGGAALVFLAAAACWLPLPRGLRTPSTGKARETFAELRLGWSILDTRSRWSCWPRSTSRSTWSSRRCSAPTPHWSPGCSRPPSRRSPCSTSVSGSWGSSISC